MSMLTTEFTINLCEPIKPGKVTIGYFDGKHPSIVAVTRSDKIFVHNPHNRSVYNPLGTDTGDKNSDGQNVSGLLAQHNSANNINDINFLNINQTITCIAAGSLSSISMNKANDSLDNIETEEIKPQSLNTSNTHKISTRFSKAQQSQNNHDLLVVGTTTSIHVYDILHNTDLYYKEIPDGANALVIGDFSNLQKSISAKSRLALIGGNCAIHGFDRDGNESYWMVTGDNITAMALVDIDNDQQNELIVGSQDCEIQVFKKDAIIAEFTETDRVTIICPLSGQMFAYALANGTVGVYRNTERVWRIKSKNQAITMLGTNLNDNNNEEIKLLTGWSNGKLDIRVALTGEVLYKENYRCSVAGIMVADYNMDGLKELIVCTVDGDVYGYRLEKQQSIQQATNLNIEQDTIRELMKKKQTLLQEIRNYEENARIQSLADPLVINKGKILTETDGHYGAIPAATKLKSSLILQCSFDSSFSDFIELRLQTTNNTKIRAAIVFAEGLFKHESFVVYPQEQDVSDVISVPLRPPKDVAIDMHCKALVGYKSSSHYHVFELSRRLPRFSMYNLVRAFYLTNSSEKINDTYDKDYEDDNWNDFSEDFNTKPKNFRSKAKQKLETLKVLQPDSFVIIHINEPISNIVRWITTNFLLDIESSSNENFDNKERRFEFISMRDQKPLIFELIKNNNNLNGKNQDRKKSHRSSPVNSDIDNYNDDLSDENDYQQMILSKDSDISKSAIIIYTESIELAGNCVQSIGDFFNINNLLPNRTKFPEEIGKLQKMIEQVEEMQTARQHLVVEVADNANLIRAAVVQAEDARLTEEYQQMKQIYNDLLMLNRDLMREYKIRCQNHQDLVESLKQINIIIQRASNLRIGSYKISFIDACRQAIKMKNFAQLFKIFNED